MATYIQSGTGQTLTDQQIASGTYGANDFFIQSGTGQQMSQAQIKAGIAPSSPTPSTVPTPAPTPSPYVNPNANYFNSGQGGNPAPAAQANTSGRTAVTLGNGQTVYYDKSGQAYDQGGNPVSGSTVASSTAPTPPPITQIGSPVTPPTNGGSTPTIPQAQAPSVAEQFNSSLAATLATQQQQLQQSLQTQQQSYQTQIDQLQKQNETNQQMEQLGLSGEQSTVAAETQAKQAALEQEQAQFKQNYEARQQLVGQLQTLLTTGQTVIEQMKGTTGLASIMNPRISQTMADVQGQAGVITATLAAYDTQIGLAQSQLSSATNAITSIYKDQLDYWSNVVSFYGGQEKSNDAQIASLSKDQQTYIAAQIQTLQDNVKQTQQTAQIIQQAMLDPTKALAYAKAGVSLTDSPAQISQKLALYEQVQQNVWGTPQKMGGDYIQTNKLTGETRTVVSNIATPGAATGTAAEREQAQLQAYSSAFVPGAKLSNGTPIMDSNGYATPAAWKQAIADFGNRAAFIKQYGYLLYAPGGKVDPGYGLTAQEAKLITG